MRGRDDARADRPSRFWPVEIGPLGFVIVWTLSEGGADWQLAAALGGAGVASIGAALAFLLPRLGRSISTLGLAALLAAVAPATLSQPLLALILLLVAIALVTALWSPETLGDLVGRKAQRLRVDLRDVRLSAALALITWLIGVASQSTIDVWIAIASAVASLLAIARVAGWVYTWLDGAARRLWPAAITTALLAAAVTSLAGALGAGLSVLALVPAGALLVARTRGIEIVDSGWSALILGHPARLVVSSFLGLCALGMVVLSLPVCAADGATITRLDAAFTAVSAVCVTGLITLDTPNAWSATGQLVILSLIQLGGLGIMALSTVALDALGRRLSVRHEEAVAGLFSREHRGNLSLALRRTLAVTFAAELAGALVLSLLFWAHGDELAMALWRGLFTAISAFCNAGFALQSDSLVGYQTAPLVLHTVAVLIIAGGLAPAVIAALPRLARRQPVPVQTKVVVAATGALLLIGFLAFAVIEWRNTLADLSVADRLHNAWFQAVTLRTAGFNSIDFADLLTVTLPLACVFMFIGGAPGGTAGGVKVTTIWVLGAAVAGAVRGHPEASSFARRIPHIVVYRAISITVISATLVMVVFTMVLLTQRMPSTHALFEVLSATGTVGLSIGGTSELDGLGKVVIMAAMFLGRVGPLTAFVLLVERQQRIPREEVEENLEVG